MNRGRNGGRHGLQTQQASSALAAITCGALPFLFQRTRRVRRGTTRLIIASVGLSVSEGHLDEIPGSDGVVAAARLLQLLALDPALQPDASRHHRVDLVDAEEALPPSGRPPWRSKGLFQAEVEPPANHE